MERSYFNIRFTMTIVIGAIIILIAYGCSSEKAIIYSDIDDYQTCMEEVDGSSMFMPNLNTINDYETMELYCVKKTGKTVSINLIVTYTADDYIDRKASIGASYDFLGHALYDSGRTLVASHRFDYDAYVIRVVSEEEFSYPAAFGMIGHSDETYKVAYMFFSDNSKLTFDFGSMKDFVDSQFAFNLE